jgi:outer membrane lipoprotein-sorting protein
MHLRLHHAAVLGFVLATSFAAKAPTADEALAQVLTKMDTAAKDFRSVEASFVWDQYTAVVKETDTSRGTVYFEREGKAINMAADIVADPKAKTLAKYVVFSDGKVQMYEPGVDRLTVYKTGKNREEVESFLVLGFGGGGHDLTKSYDVSYLGAETVSGVDTAKLELISKSPKAREKFPRILLWIDSKQGISVQQQLFQQDGNYRLAKYSKILINQKLPDGVFKVKTTSKTTYLAPQG